MRISDWISDVCSSDLDSSSTEPISLRYMRTGSSVRPMSSSFRLPVAVAVLSLLSSSTAASSCSSLSMTVMPISNSSDMMTSIFSEDIWSGGSTRSGEHTSELQSLMRTSYAVFCLKQKNITNTIQLDLHNEMSYCNSSISI